MCTIGMSNTTQESRSFLKLLTVTEGVNPKVLVIDCAQGAQTAGTIKDPNLAYWKMVNRRIQNAEATPQQVQVVWMKEANGNPKGPVLDYARQLEADESAVLNNLNDKFPNVKIAYLSNRIYGGNAGSPLNPEPYAYASSFSVKWLIASQIEGKPEVNYDPAKGAVRAPWIAWGPDLWADGLKGRVEERWILKLDKDTGPDGTHPSMLGREKVARLLMDFLKKNDPTSRPWFVK